MTILTQGRAVDLGDGFIVQRILPHAQVRSVGPFVFLDHFGPHRFNPGSGIDVRPHPHIGLSTLSYLVEGAIMHRDSLGMVQKIEPGAVNWMTAGKGIVHSERTPPETRAVISILHGLQFWVALPEEHEEIEPSFQHVAKDQLPLVSIGAARGVLIAGKGFAAQSPVNVYSNMALAAFTLRRGEKIMLTDFAAEQALYLVAGALRIASVAEPMTPGHLLKLDAGSQIEIAALEDSLFVALGGDPLGHRHLHWNFVSSSLQRIEQARADWAEQRFGKVPGETEFIPLPAK